MSENKFLISERDLEMIVSDAKRMFATESFPIVISNNRISQTNYSHYFIVQAFLLYANRNELLNKDVGFDITQYVSQIKK